MACASISAKHPVAVIKSSSKLSSKWPDEPNTTTDEQTLYQLEGYIGYTGFTAAQSDVRSDVLDRLIVGSNQEMCTGCTTTYTDPGTPSEFAFWMSVVQFFSQLDVEPFHSVEKRGFGTHLHEIKALHQETDDPDVNVTESISMETVHFQIQTGIQCESTVKLYAEDLIDRTSPSALTREWLLNNGYTKSEDYGSDAAAKGMNEYHFSQRQQNENYELILSLVEELQYSDLGRWSSFELHCESDAPIFASEVDGFSLGLNRHTLEQGYWTYFLKTPLQRQP